MLVDLKPKEEIKINLLDDIDVPIITYLIIHIKFMHYIKFFENQKGPRIKFDSMYKVVESVNLTML